MGAIWIMAVGVALVASGCVEEASPPPDRVTPADYVGFRPASRVQDGRTVMPLTFIDGSTAVVTAPVALGVDGMEAAMFTAGGLERVDRTMSFRHGTPGSLMHEGPLETYDGAGGDPVEVWEGTAGDWECPNLVYRFGGWFVGVRTCQSELTRVEKEAWARSLEGRVTDDGFLVLDATPPLVLRRAGGHDGPKLILGRGRGNWIEMEPGRCDPARLPDEGDVRTMADGTRVSFSRIGGAATRYDRYAEWCEDGLMRVQITDATKGFAEAAAQGFRLTGVAVAE